jgi:hypothetical protein
VPEPGDREAKRTVRKPAPESGLAVELGRANWFRGKLSGPRVSQFWLRLVARRSAGPWQGGLLTSPLARRSSLPRDFLAEALGQREG